MIRFSFLIIALISINIYSQNKLTTIDSKDHIGDSAFVTGIVSEIFTSNKGNTFISFDDYYPNHTFSVVIFKKNNINISNIMIGKVLTVCGIINSFNDKPQIIVTSQDQIIKIE